MADFDPERSHLHRLFLFWEAYEKEFTNLLKEWHEDTTRVRNPDDGPTRSTGNILYDSFLDTWGKGEFEDGVQFNTDRIPLEKKSYFAALAVVSRQIRNECFTVLRGILEPDGDDNFKLPLALLPGVDQSKADRLARDKTDSLFAVFDSREIPSLETIDDAVEKENKPPKPHNMYLEALDRMMKIETNCFIVQAEFLKSGKVVSGGVRGRVPAS